MKNKLSDNELLLELEKIAVKKKWKASDICKELNINKNTLTNWRKGNKIAPKNKIGILSVLETLNIDKNTPPLSNEEQVIVDFFRDPENKLERYELLARIERAKKTSPGENGLGERQAKIA